VYIILLKRWQCRSCTHHGTRSYRRQWSTAGVWPHPTLDRTWGDARTEDAIQPGAHRCPPAGYEPWGRRIASRRIGEAGHDTCSVWSVVYGAVESVTVLRRPRNYRDIIIIIIRNDFDLI